MAHSVPRAIASRLLAVAVLGTLITPLAWSQGQFERPGQNAFFTEAAPSLLYTSPFDGESQVALTRETILRFSTPVEPLSVHGDSIFAEFAGSPFPLRHHISPDGLRVTLFYDTILPASSRIKVTIDGDQLVDFKGRSYDVQGQFIPGGVKTLEFDTVTITTLPGTAVCGRVFASRSLSNGQVDRPLEGVVITVDGAESEYSATTDPAGNFRLDPAPVGQFFVHIDGQDAIGLNPGDKYPTVGKVFTSIPGQATNLHDIFLPLIVEDTLQPVSQQSDTLITFPPEVLAEFPEFVGTQLTVPADSLFADDGTRGGMVGIAPVPKDRLPGPLPADIDPPFVITIQTDGPTNFDRPVPVTFPNLPHPETGEVYAPGSKVALFNFNHDTGNWETSGSMTVSDDGLFIVSDFGTGAPAPGWNLPAPGGLLNAGLLDLLDCGRDVVRDLLFCAGNLLGITDAAKCALAVGVGTLGLIEGCFLEGGGSCLGALSNALGGTALACGKFAGKTIAKPIVAIFQAVRCVGSLVATVRNCRGLFLRGDDPDLILLEQRAAELLAFGTPFAEYFGDEEWLAINRVDDVVQQFWLETFFDFIQDSSEEGVRLTEGERNALLAQPIASNLTSVHVNDFVDRWNRTQDYWDQGILTEDQVPPGQDTDFIDLERWSEQARSAIAVAEQWQDEGFSGIFDALDQAAFRVMDNVAGVGNRVKAPELSYYVRVSDDLEANSVHSFEFRLRSSPQGTIPRFVLPAQTMARFDYLDPVEFRVASMISRTAENGSSTRLITPILTVSDSLDSDGDGLHDEGEIIVGTDPFDPDSDDDGVNDAAEVRANTNPLDGSPALTGIIASLNTDGDLRDISAFDSQVVLADGPSGIRVVNIFNRMDPVTIAQFVTQGEARAVSTDGDFVSVAEGNLGAEWLDIRNLPDVTRLRHWDVSEFGSPVDATLIAAETLFFGTRSGDIFAIDLRFGLIVDQLELGDAIQDLFVQGETLFVLTSRELITVPFLEGALAVAGRTPSPGGIDAQTGRNRLFVGGGVAYAARVDGVNSFDVSDPQNPLPIDVGRNSGRAGWRHLVANGSGLGLVAFRVFAAQDIGLFDVNDPEQIPENILGTLLTPGSTTALQLFNSFAYVADSEAGLQVVNYLAPDPQGIAPSVQIQTNTDGTIVEGSPLLITANVSDDVEVRSVELFIDGEVAQIDGSFPFEFLFLAPSAAQTASLDLSLRATDTGGNAAFSTNAIVNILPDTVSPSITRLNPDNGNQVVDLDFLENGWVIDFDEAMDPTTLDATSVQLISAGPDLLLDTPDDVALSIQTNLAAFLRRLVIVSDLAPLGPAKLVLEGDQLSDLAGNRLDADGDGFPGGRGEILVTIIDPIEIRWIGSTGVWDNVLNWSSGVLPGPFDTAILDVGGTETITHDAGTSIIASLLCAEDLTLSEGEIRFAKPSTIDGNLIMIRGRLGGSDLFLSQPFDFRGGTLTTGGTFVMNAGGIMGSNQPKFLEGDRVLENNALFELNDGNLRLTDDSKFKNFGEVKFTGEAGIGFPSETGVFENLGRLVQDAGGVTAEIRAITNNLGDIEVKQGELKFQADLVHRGTLDVADGATLSFILDSASSELFGAITASPTSAIRFGQGTHGFQDGFELSGAPAQFVAGFGDAVIDGNVTLDGLLITGLSTIEGQGTLNINGDALIRGNFDGDITTMTSPSHTVTVGTPSPWAIRENHRFENLSQLLWDVAADIRVNSPGTLINDSGAEIIHSGSGNMDSDGVFENRGLYRKTSLETVTIEVSLIHTGTIEIEQGTLQLRGTSDSSGIIDVDAGATITFFSGPHQWMSGLQFLGDGMVNITGDVTSTSTLSIHDLIVDNRLHSSNQIDIRGDLNLRGDLRGPGVTRLLPGSTGSPTSLNFIREGHTLQIAGTFTTDRDIRIGDNAELLIEPTGQWTVNASTAIENAGGGGIFRNQGTLTTNATFGIGSAIPFENSGVLELNTGVNSFNGALTQTAGTIILGPGSPEVRGSVDIQGGVVEGEGVFEDPVTCSGTLQPGGPAATGTLEFQDRNDALTLQSSARVEIEIASPSDFDLLFSGQELVLDGTLAISLLAGFTPALGDTFEIVTFDSATGAFVGFEGLDIGPGLEFQVNQEAQRVLLTVVAAP